MLSDISVATSMYYTFYQIFSDEIYKEFHNLVQDNADADLKDALLQFHEHMGSVRDKVNAMRTELQAYANERNVGLSVVVNQMAHWVAKHPTETAKATIEFPKAMKDLNDLQSNLAKCYPGMLKKIFPEDAQDTVRQVDKVIYALKTKDADTKVWLQKNLPEITKQLQTLPAAITARDFSQEVLKRSKTCLSLNAGVHQRKLEDHLAALTGKPAAPILELMQLDFIEPPTKA